MTYSVLVGSRHVVSMGWANSVVRRCIDYHCFRTGSKWQQRGYCGSNYHFRCLLFNYALFALNVAMGRLLVKCLPNGWRYSYNNVTSTVKKVLFVIFYVFSWSIKVSLCCRFLVFEDFLSRRLHRVGWIKCFYWVKML